MLRPTAKKTHTKYAVLSWLLLFFATAAFSQLNADFSASKTGGCSPLTVYFTNTTTGASSAATYKWDFGNGNTSAIKTNTGSTYKDAQAYTVTLTVTDGSQTSTKQQTITVYKKPEVDFSASVPNGCMPVTVNFSSNASPGDGSITNYFWDFGDGVTQGGANLSQPVHSYDFPQKASVSLTVTNSFGCYTYFEKSELVKVNRGVKADFNADKPALCKETDAINFKNLSKGSGNFTYLWDFGDGQTSTQKDPSYVYNKKGIFTVKLTVNSDEGCTSTMVLNDYVHVATNFNVDFEAPQVACTGKKISFVNKSDPVAQSVLWQTDEGHSSSKSDTAVFTFSTPGIHKVTLTNTYGACKASATKDIEIQNKPNVKGFEIITTGECGTPQTVNFRDTTAGAVKWQWDFRSGTTTVDDSVQAPSYRYYTDGNYTITLIVANAAGCSDTVQKMLTLKTPQVTIEHTKSTSKTGNTSCEPFKITLGVTTSEPIKEYNWDLGNGTTSTSATPEATYTLLGNYPIKLKYITQKGCTGESAYTASLYEKPQILGISVSPTDVCGNTPVTFSAQATGSVTEWKWDFGEPDPNNPSASSVTHKYSREGTFSVKLIATNGSCGDTAVKANVVNVVPPFPKISSVLNTCDGNRGEITFTQTAAKSTQWDWDFGDGTTQSLTDNVPQVKHAYSKSGAYKVKLTTTYGQCTVADSLTAYVLLKQSPNLTANRIDLCTSDNLGIKVDNLESNPHGVSPHYFVRKLEYQDGSAFAGTYTSDPSSTETSIAATLNGLADNGNLKVILQSEYFGCYDTTNFITLNVRGPIPDMEVQSGSKLCYETPFVFKDLSKGSNNVALKIWEWDFGDGKKEVLNTGDVVQHVYEDPGSYDVSIKVTDEEGCSAFTPYGLHVVEASGPKAVALPADTAILPSTTVDFYNYSNSYNSASAVYKWQFTDGTTSTSLNVSKKYTNTGVYVEKLIASDPTTQCTDTAYITVRVLKVAVSFTSALTYLNNANCPPLLAKFTNTSENVDSVDWDFGDGGYSGNQNFPSHTYNQPGIYTVKLRGYTANGLSDSITQEIKVAGPYAKLSADVQSGCLKQTVTLTGDIKDASSFVWDLGDGTLKQSTLTTIVHEYKSPGVYTPSLIMNDNSGCSSTFELPQKIVIDSLHVSLDSAANRFCDSALVEFVPQIHSIAADQLGVDLKYRWDFGTGQPQDVADTRNASFQYKKSGQYQVKLKVESPYGCVQEVTLPVTIVASPKASISGPAAVCQGATAQFKGNVSNATGTVEWNWKFSNGSTSTEQNASVLVPDPTPLDVTLIVKSNECSDTATSQVLVNLKPAVRATAARTTICLGDTVQLNAEGTGNCSWTPPAGLSSTTIASPVAKPQTTTTYTVQITDGIGCSNTDSVKVTVNGPFKLSVSGDAVICEGKSVQLQAGGAAFYEWSGNSNAPGINNPNIPNPVVTPLTSTEYTVVGYDSLRCFKDEARVKVTVNPAPKVSAGPDAEVLALDTYQLQSTGSNDITQWRWSPSDYLSCTDCAMPVTRPRSPVTYVVKVKNQFACETSDTVNIKLVCTDTYVFIPNTFTPNNDGKNDRFYIRGRGVSTVKSFSIYNRWGEVVFQRTNFSADDRSAGWDGKYKGGLVQAGSYIYIAEMQCNAGVPFTQKGTITVVY